MRRCLVTGGTGFVGANLVRRLLKDGHAVHLLVRPEHQDWRIRDIRPDLCVHRTDLTRASRLSGVLRKVRPDWIFHLAAYGAYSAQSDFPMMLKTNFQGTVDLLDASLAQGFESFVQVGSSSEYGFKDHAPTENEALVPNSAYALTKAFATLFCQFRALSSEGQIAVLRPSSVYGPYEEPTRLFPALILSGLAGELPPLVGPEVAHDFLYVDDFVEACLLAARETATENGAIYNVGTGVQTSLREMVGLAKSCLPIRTKPRWGSMKSRAWDSAVWVSDSRLIRKALGWAPRYSLRQGFLAMVEWFKGNPRRLEFYRQARRKGWRR